MIGNHLGLNICIQNITIEVYEIIFCGDKLDFIGNEAMNKGT